jgi:hypothetical protein
VGERRPRKLQGGEIWYKMLRETRLTMPVITPDFGLLFIFRFPLLNFGARYGNDSRCPPFESRDRRFVRRWLRFFHVRSVPNERAKSNVVAKPGKRIPPNLTSQAKRRKRHFHTRCYGQRDRDARARGRPRGIEPTICQNQFISLPLCDNPALTEQTPNEKCGHNRGRSSRIVHLQYP